MNQKLPNLRQYVIQNYPPQVRLIVYLKHPPLLNKEDLGDLHDFQGKPVSIPNATDPNIPFSNIAAILKCDEEKVRIAYHNFILAAQSEIYRADSPPTRTMDNSLPRIPLVKSENCVAEAQRGFLYRLQDGFWNRFVRPGPVVDIGFSGGHPGAQPIFPNAIGLDLDTPGYNGKDLPYRDSSIGTIHGSHLLEHIADYQYFFRECLRVLMPGGTLIIMVPLMEAYENRLVGPSVHNPDHKRFYTASRLCQELEFSLPRSLYRIIHLRENYNTNDIGRPKDSHANGPAYEIECVVEKSQPGAKYGAALEN